MISKRSKKYISFILIISFLILIFIFINNTSIHKYFYNVGANLLNTITYEKKDISKNITLGINRELEKENNELKLLLSLKEDVYSLITAKVIKRDNWYQELVINKGKINNINVNDSVISNRTLIGRIKEVGDNYSIVELLTSNRDSSKISVSIGNSYGIVTSYSYKEDVLIVDNMLKNSDINILDKVYTSGLGELDDAGIYIGYVVDIEYDKLGLNKIIKIKPSINLNDIRYVGIISK